MIDFKTINPATEETIEEYQYENPKSLTKKIEQSYKAWVSWKDTSFQYRSDLLLTLAKLLVNEKEDIGLLITQEMGKPLKQSIAEIEKCAWVCEYYAHSGEMFLKPDIIESDATESFVSYEPLGPIMAIMPWNFPFWQVFRFAAPNLMAGNTGILKHSPNTTGCSLKIQALFEKAGFPENTFQSIIAHTDDIEGVIGNKFIAGVTLTGSTKAGRSVASLAGKYLKKTVLELGGSDPYLILEDADLSLAAEKCVTGRLINTGQSCIAAKRFIVTYKNEAEFTEKVRSLMAQKEFGDPVSNQFDLGSMARGDLRQQLHNQVKKTIEMGAQCILGGTLPDSAGYFYPATLLTNVTKNMPAYEEELFGPVASILVVKDEEEAIRVANDTSYGLGGAVFTDDPIRGKEIAHQIQAGCVFVNDFVKSDPRLPFGGVKSSGYGRELSPLGIKEFVNAKTVYLT
ncbi:NAD-dependent succinate-semialdehyde dehydrogenase [Marinoscillum sp.]|uniref:NAD-dependent succinate-semialdehyde dehydrogenase n=1 Tax=Marinoscillum sp. TaxID=2024838 RepID=UPI003BAC2AAB